MKAQKAHLTPDEGSTSAGEAEEDGVVSEAAKPPERKPPSTSGKPIIDTRKFKTFEQEIGKCIRMNTELRKHCNGPGAQQSEAIRKHLSNCIDELKLWRLASTT